MTYLTLPTSHCNSPSISPVSVLSCSIRLPSAGYTVNACRLFLATAGSEHTHCQDPLLLCSRACCCCTLLAFPGKDNVRSDVSANFRENKVVDVLLSIARGYVTFSRMYAFHRGHLIVKLNVCLKLWWWEKLFIVLAKMYGHPVIVTGIMYTAVI